jgi:hypothetical protein
MVTRAPMLPLLPALLLLAAMAAWGEARALEPNGLFEPGWRAHIGANAGAYAIRRAPAPDGRPAIRFELRSGDCMASRVRDCDTHRERAELRSVDEAPPGSERWYRYGLFVPFGHPEPGIAEIMGQFHNGEAPVLSSRHGGGEMRFVQQTGRGARVLETRADFPKGQWMTITTHCRWSAEEDGFCRVLLNGRAVHDYRGPTVMRNAGRGVYLKIGLYRSHLDRINGSRTPTGVVYFSDVETGEGAPPQQ